MSSKLSEDKNRELVLNLVKLITIVFSHYWCKMNEGPLTHPKIVHTADAKLIEDMVHVCMPM